MIEIIIPARLDSSRFPNKLLETLGSKTILEHVYDRASLTGLPVRIVGDSTNLQRALPMLPISVYDDSVRNGTDRISGFADEGDDSDIIVNVQGDLPFIDPDQILSVIPALNHGDIGTLVMEMNPHQQMNPNSVKAICTGLHDNLLRAHWFCRAPITYGFHHIGLYAFRRKTLREYKRFYHEYEDLERLEQLRWLAMGKTIVAVLTHEIPIEINTPEDLQFARSLIG